MGDVIRLAGLRFFTILGDLPHERTTPQPLEVDVEVTADTRPAGESDRLEDALDYRAVYETVARAAKGDAASAPHLLEALCRRIADRVLELDRVERVRVRCRKPWAALGGPVDRVEVEIERP